jgi:hypothetical protein
MIEPDGTKIDMNTGLKVSTTASHPRCLPRVNGQNSLTLSHYITGR